MSDLTSNPKTFRELCDEWVKADQKENGHMPINLKIAAGQFARWLDKRGLSVETEAPLCGCFSESRCEAKHGAPAHVRCRRAVKSGGGS